MAVMMEIKDIKVGERARKDLGDIRKLAANIKEIGLLHPIVVTKTGQLISGGRRLEACKLNGCQRVPVHIVNFYGDDKGALKAELYENTMRKALLPSEIDAIRRRLEPAEKGSRQKAHGRGQGSEPRRYLR